jgi:uncharacterized membrane protein (UPF0127 family)
MLRLLPIVLLLAAVVTPGPARSAEPLPTRVLTIGKQKVTVEVVDTPDKRATGLMNRFSLQTDHGMLFVFDQPQPLAFWMKNTYIPLSIAFLDAEGTILNIEDMQPQDVSTHWSRGLALYAIEMRQGWFAGKGITPGVKVTGLPPAAQR